MEASVCVCVCVCLSKTFNDVRLCVCVCVLWRERTKKTLCRCVFSPVSQYAISL